MIIAARNLPKYFHSLQFPLSILEEKGSKVAMRADRPILMALIQSSSVIGIGTWKSIKALRLNRPMEQLSEIRLGAASFSGGTKYSFDSATDENPQNVWALKEITHIDRSLFMQVQTDCLAGQ